MDWSKTLKARLSRPVDPSALSSVLAPLGFHRELKEHVILFIKRPEAMENHAGQICFPGGFREKADADLLETALRETHEELGIDRKHVQVLGPLGPVLTRRSVSIQPWVGALEFPYDLKTSASEVSRTFFLPIRKLLEKPLPVIEVKTESGWILKGPGLYWENETIWGATAMMLVELREHLLKCHL